MRSLLFTLMIAVAAPCSAASEGMTSTFLLNHCEKDTLFCNGYLMGISNVTSAANSARHEVQRTGWVWCLPASANYEQMRLVTIKWFKEHPELLHYSPDSLVTKAWAEAFPCP